MIEFKKVEKFLFPNKKNVADAISEIIHQLVENSLDHAFKGVDNKEICIQADIIDGFIEIRYRDNGNGLSKQGQDELFNPFYTTMRGFQGKIGLGMYLTFNLLTQLLEGAITVEKPEQGILMVMKFPARLH